MAIATLKACAGNLLCRVSFIIKIKNMLTIDQNLLNQIYTESRRTYPDEGCGFVLGTITNGKRLATEVIPVKNIQNELHTKDPQRYPREAKTAYTIDPKEMERIEKEAKQKDLKLLCIFHSHPEHGVYFSAEDKGMAAPWGEPLFPELSYLVISVYEGIEKNCSEFYWNPEQNDFVERTIL